ncbi:MAG: DUF2975 domain-containing protein [Chlamydiota bacterium]
MHKIQKVSQIFRFLFLAIMILMPFFTISYWYTGNSIGLIVPASWTEFLQSQGCTLGHNSELYVYTALTSGQKFFAFLTSLIPLSISLIILYFLVKLFSLYESLIIFTEKNVKLIRNIGYTILFGEALHFIIYEPLFSLAVTFSNPPGQRMIKISIQGENIAWICAGFLLILISWIMNEGRKLQEEQEHIV